MGAPTSSTVSRDAVPAFGTVVLDCPDPDSLAAFYARLLEWDRDPDSHSDWVTLLNPNGGTEIEFQRVPGYQAPEWPSTQRPQQLHLDLRVRNMQSAHERALDLGARLLDDTAERFRVYADPEGHPFCLCQC